MARTYARLFLLIVLSSVELWLCVSVLVGSIKTTVEEGESVKRGQEFGYFAFGTLFPLFRTLSPVPIYLLPLVNP